MTVRRWRIRGTLPRLVLYLRIGRWVLEVNEAHPAGRKGTPSPDTA